MRPTNISADATTAPYNQEINNENGVNPRSGYTEENNISSKNITQAEKNNNEKINGVPIFDGSSRPSTVAADGSLIEDTNNKSGVVSPRANAKINTPVQNITQATENDNKMKYPEELILNGTKAVEVYEKQQGFRPAKKKNFEEKMAREFEYNDEKITLRQLVEKMAKGEIEESATKIIKEEQEYLDFLKENIVKPLETIQSAGLSNIRSNKKYNFTPNSVVGNSAPSFESSVDFGKEGEFLSDTASVENLKKLAEILGGKLGKGFLGNDAFIFGEEESSKIFSRAANIFNGNEHLKYFQNETKENTATHIQNVDNSAEYVPPQNSDVGKITIGNLNVFEAYKKYIEYYRSAEEADKFFEHLSKTISFHQETKPLHNFIERVANGEISEQALGTSEAVKTYFHFLKNVAKDLQRDMDIVKKAGLEYEKFDKASSDYLVNIYDENSVVCKTLSKTKKFSNLNNLNKLAKVLNGTQKVNPDGEPIFEFNSSRNRDFFISAANSFLWDKQSYYFKPAERTVQQPTKTSSDKAEHQQTLFVENNLENVESSEDYFKKVLKNADLSNVQLHGKNDFVNYANVNLNFVENIVSFSMAFPNKSTAETFNKIAEKLNGKRTYQDTMSNEFSFKNSYEATNFAGVSEMILHNARKDIEALIPSGTINYKFFKPDNQKKSAKEEIVPAENLRFISGEFKHTKTGKLMPSAELTGLTDKFSELNSLAKKYGGSYSKFAKRFLFKTEGGRNKFVEEASRDILKIKSVEVPKMIEEQKNESKTNKIFTNREIAEKTVDSYKKAELETYDTIKATFDAYDNGTMSAKEALARARGAYSWYNDNVRIQNSKRVKQFEEMIESFEQYLKEAVNKNDNAKNQSKTKEEKLNSAGIETFSNDDLIDIEKLDRDIAEGKLNDVFERYEVKFDKHGDIVSVKDKYAKKETTDNNKSETEKAAYEGAFTEDGHLKNPHLARKAFEEKINPLRGIYFINKETGIAAQISKKGVGKLVSDKAITKSVANGYNEQQHFEAATNIKELYENASLTESRADKNNEPDVLSRACSH